MMKIKIKLIDGTIIRRKAKIVSFGNFQQMIVRYNNDDYIVGDGDEYIRGGPDFYTLGKKLGIKEYNTESLKNASNFSMRVIRFFCDCPIEYFLIPADNVMGEDDITCPLCGNKPHSEDARTIKYEKIIGGNKNE